MPGRRPKDGEDAGRTCIHGVVVVRIAQKRILQKEKKGRDRPMGDKGHSVRTAGCPAERERVLRGVTDLTGTCRLP